VFAFACEYQLFGSGSRFKKVASEIKLSRSSAAFVFVLLRAQLSYLVQVGLEKLNLAIFGIRFPARFTASLFGLVFCGSGGNCPALIFGSAPDRYTPGAGIKGSVSALTTFVVPASIFTGIVAKPLVSFPVGGLVELMVPSGLKLTSLIFVPSGIFSPFTSTQFF